MTSPDSDYLRCSNRPQERGGCTMMIVAIAILAAILTLSSYGCAP